MDTTFQQIQYIQNKLKYIVPIKPKKSQNNIAIVIHVFYSDIWQKELKAYLQNLKIEFDLYLTIPQGMEESKIKEIFEDYPTVRLYMVENRGRDVLPFLQVMNVIGLEQYKYICKLHTKKTGESALGNIWRKLLYFDLIGSTTNVNDILKIFKENLDVGMITGKNTILDSEKYVYENSEKVQMLVQETEIIQKGNYVFAAGTMFWTRSEILEPIVELFQKNKLNFEEEEGQTENTLAHAIERFFGILCQTNNQSIVPSPSDYTLLGNGLLTELSSLVLSQQYAGKDMFVAQKQYIQNLENVVDSMRLKNRLKNISSKIIFISNKIFKLPHKVIKISKVLKHNPTLLKKVLYYISRGELSYLLTKIKEKSRQNLTQSNQFIEVKNDEYFTQFDEEAYSLKGSCIDIIIPVYNGYEFLEALFNSIEKNTSAEYRLIVVNDCSSDDRIKPYLLQRLKKHPTALFIDHKENQGFLKSVNEAYEHVSNHFVLLNTDTEVPSFWLERLMYPILYMSKIASTTPFTNSGEIASFPNFVADNEIFDGMSVDMLDESFKKVNAKNFYTEVPTGVGFCMGINYNLSKKIGLFAEDAFGKGYGEENDWCQRAIKEEYKNIIVPNLFVYHKHGGSFSEEEKEKLLQKNAVILLNRYPNYSKDVQNYIQKDPHQTLRQLLVLHASNTNKPLHLIFDHDLGGGANLYTHKLIQNYKADKKNILLIRYDYYSHYFKILYYYKEYQYSFKIGSLSELKKFVDTLKIEEIFLNNLVSYKNPQKILSFLKKLVEDTTAKLIVPIHDFYTLCPSYNLLNQEGKYCDVPELDTCKICINKNMQEWRNFYNGENNISNWREIWGTLLNQSDQIWCFSQSSKEIFLKAYPKISNQKIKIIPHEIKDINPLYIKKDINKTNITIGILGAIDYVKGAHIVKELVQLIERDKLDINVVVIGEITEQIRSKRFHVTGRYKHEDLPNLVQKHQIDVFIIPSIIPETFSYTAQEIMMMQLPLIVFNLGAPAERVVKYKNGYVINDMNAQAIIKCVEHNI